MLAKRLQSAATDNGQDVVLDGTGDSKYPKLERKVQEARDDGYRVVGTYATVPTDQAVSRSNERSLKPSERRFVPEAVIRGTHRDVSRVLPEAVDQGLFDEVRLIDTSVQGQARLVMTGGRGRTTDIVDPGLWAEFTGKANE